VLDDVFAAKGEADWFLTETGQGAAK
jgi:hypothetical protein